jgi:hypothetical protein
MVTAAERRNIAAMVVIVPIVAACGCLFCGADTASLEFAPP